MAKRTKASAGKTGAARKAVGPVKPIPAAYHVRDVHVSAIVDAVKKLCIDANLELEPDMLRAFDRDRKSTRLNSSHGYISYAVFCLKKKRQYCTTLHSR